jgi:ABC-type methionine transport system permease subunit
MVIAIVALVQIVQEAGMFIARKIDKRKKVS